MPLKYTVCNGAEKYTREQFRPAIDSREAGICRLLPKRASLD